MDAAGEIFLDKSSPWDFGSILVGSPSTEILTITNNGLSILDIFSITIVTGGQGFTISAVRDHGGSPIVTGGYACTIAVSETIEVDIEFDPTSSALHTDVLSIEHNGINVGTPVNTTLEGRGETTFTFSFTGAKVAWTVPAGVTSLTIEVWGAEGGGYGNGTNGTPGKGARMKGDFVVSPGQVIDIAVGELGKFGGRGGGGGGGSFVVSSGTAMIIAGGGGGTHYNNGNKPAKDAVVTATCTPHTSTGTGYTAGSGGGFSADGANGDRGTTGGKSWGNGLAGGQFATSPNAHWSNGNGGYGGGGGGCWGPGSGGGYNGGVCPTSGGGQTPGGTGGGSYNNGTNQSNSPGVRTGNGEVVFKF